MKCPACGADLTEGANFCEYCGTPVAAAPAPEVVSAPADAPKATPTLEIPPAPKAPEPEVAAAPAQDQTYSYQQPQEEAPQPMEYVQPDAAGEPLSGKCKTFGIIGFILGLWSTVFCWLGVLPAAGIGLGFFMVASAIVGLVFCNISRKNGNFKLAKVGKVFAIIGLVLSAILWIVGIILTAAIAVNGGFNQ